MINLLDSNPINGHSFMNDLKKEFDKREMKVKELIQKLLDYNLDAEVSVVAHHIKEEFTITYGGNEGSTQNNCETVSFYVDRLCNNEISNTKKI